MSAGTAPRPDHGTDQVVAFFDLLDPRFQPDGPEVHAAREACWYTRTPLGYAILRYDEMAALLRDRHLRQGGVETLAAQGIMTGPMADWMRRMMLNIEGEEHTRLRRLVSKAFTPRAVDALRPVMRAVTHELIDRVAAHGECEFMAAFADPYASRIIGALLGIPRERYAQFHGWATDLGLGFSYAVAEHLARIEAALQGLYACVDDLLAARRAAPGPDLISALLSISARSFQRCSKCVARMAQGAILAWNTLETVPQSVAHITIGARRAARQPEAVDIAALLPCSVAANRQEASMRCGPCSPSMPDFSPAIIGSWSLLKDMTMKTELVVLLSTFMTLVERSDAQRCSRRAVSLCAVAHGARPLPSRLQVCNPSRLRSSREGSGLCAAHWASLRAHLSHRSRCKRRGGIRDQCTAEMGRS